MTERFDKAVRAGHSAKGLVHYERRLEKAKRRGNARKIAKFKRKVQKYKNAYYAPQPIELDDAALEREVLAKLCHIPLGTTELQRGAPAEEVVVGAVARVPRSRRH